MRVVRLRANTNPIPVPFGQPRLSVLCSSGMYYIDFLHGFMLFFLASAEPISCDHEPTSSTILSSQQAQRLQLSRGVEQASLVICASKCPSTLLDTGVVARNRRESASAGPPRTPRTKRYVSEAVRVCGYVSETDIPMENKTRRSPLKYR